jgi:hypothetical protein
MGYVVGLFQWYKHSIFRLLCIPVEIPVKSFVCPSVYRTDAWSVRDVDQPSGLRIVP